jgi:uncharacterized cupin superfamily protein
MEKPPEMLTATDIETLQSQRRVHALNPNAIRLTKSLGDAVGLTQIGINLVTIMPGHASAEYHRHLYEEECVYVLSGCGQVEIDDKAYDISAGTFIGFPAQGKAHGISNNSTEPLVLLVTGQRLIHDVCEYPRKKKWLHLNGTLEALVDY